MTALKVEKPLWKRIVPAIGAIRCWCGHTKFEMNSTVERGEHPELLIKRTKREKTGEPEVEIVFLGSHHDEHHSYYKKDPAEWKTFGNIVLTPEKAQEVGDILTQAGSLTLLDFKPMVVSLGKLTRTLSQAGRRRRAHGRIQRSARRKNS